MNLLPTPVAYDATPGGPNNHYKGIGNQLKHTGTIKQPSTSSPAASPASLFPALDKGKGRQITAFSGRRCSELYAKYSPLGSLVKMLLESSTWRSTKCYLTWKTRTTPAKRLLFQLAPSMRPIGETGCGLLPTATVNDSKNNAPPSQHERNTKALVAAMWPTPKRPSGGGQMERATPGGGIRKLEDRVSQIEGYNTGALNPQFCEHLMGYPKNWTEVD